MSDAATHIVTANLPGGGSIALEVISLQAPDSEQRVSNVPHEFKDLTDSLQGMSSAIYEAIKAIAPKKATVEFGIEVAVESGKLTALWVKGSGKANLKLTLEWES